jgi:hypothetical protein
MTPQLVVEILKALREGEQPRLFRVVNHGLPVDTVLKETFYDEVLDTVVFVLESACFEIPSDAQLHRSGYPLLPSTEMTVA